MFRAILEIAVQKVFVRFRYLARLQQTRPSILERTKLLPSVKLLMLMISTIFTRETRQIMNSQSMCNTFISHVSMDMRLLNLE